MLAHWSFFLFLFIPGVTAIAILFWVWLVSFLTAFGNRQWVWGALVLVLLPLAIPYCLLHRQSAAYPLRLLGLMTALLVLPLGYAATQGWFSGERPTPASLLPAPSGAGQPLPTQP